jgi:NADPH-dependent curcumin reductase
MAQPVNRQWLLTSRPRGLLKESDFTWNESQIPEPAEGQALVRNIYLSLDPTNRGWASDRTTYMPPVELGTPMRGFAIGIVEKSHHPDFQEGQLLEGFFGWQDFCLTDGNHVTPVHLDPELPLSAHFGLFAHIGLTAYFGLLEIGEPKPGETLVVSGAAGAVGSLVGQIGKIKGCHVVGIAGTDEKCHWLTEELGFDGAINYKAEKVQPRLKELCPDGIDVIFENVGGPILDASLSLMNLHARVALCGLISMYNAEKMVPGPFGFPYVLVRRAKIQGFIIGDYMHRAAEAIPEITHWYKEGKLKYRLDIVDGLEEAPKVVNRLFDGSHKGKLLVQVSDEPGA